MKLLGFLVIEVPSRLKVLRLRLVHGRRVAGIGVDCHVGDGGGDRGEVHRLNGRQQPQGARHGGCDCLGLCLLIQVEKPLALDLNHTIAFKCVENVLDFVERPVVDRVGGDIVDEAVIGVRDKHAPVFGAVYPLHENDQVVEHVDGVALDVGHVRQSC